MSSEWNKTLLRILQVQFQKELPRVCAEQDMELPYRSHKYYGNLVAERFQRLAQVWKQSQPKMMTGGSLESPERVERRMAADREVTAKKRRHLSRRLYVCGQPCA
jgi:hypothetical protein